MADSSYNTHDGVYRAQAGKELHFGSSGVIAENTPVSATAATLTVTAAAHGGKTIVLDRAAGVTATLPDATGSGVEIEFVVKTTASGGSYIVQVPDANNVMTGWALLLQDAGDTVVGFATAATSDTITLNGTTTGGIAGATIRVRDVAADLWSVQVVSDASGTEATPFSAAVA